MGDERRFTSMIRYRPGEPAEVEVPAHLLRADGTIDRDAAAAEGWTFQDEPDPPRP